MNKNNFMKAMSMIDEELLHEADTPYTPEASCIIVADRPLSELIFLKMKYTEKTKNPILFLELMCITAFYGKNSLQPLRPL